MNVLDLLREYTHNSQRKLKSFFNIPEGVKVKTLLAPVEPPVYTLTRYPYLEKKQIPLDLVKSSRIIVLSSLNKDKAASDLKLVDEFLARVPAVGPYIIPNVVEPDDKFQTTGLDIKIKIDAPYDVKEYVASLCCSVELCSGDISMEHIDTVKTLLSKR